MILQRPFRGFLCLCQLRKKLFGPRRHGSRLLLFLSPIYPRGGCSSPCSSLSGLIVMGSSKRVSCDKITSGLQKGFCVLSRDHSG